ncbi:chemotaxis protein CheB [Solimonas terrae]|uniref:protein-glutamate methylesterase n=1 Tax=Solimonas terrae TaxID=1396819 RepID=A0A6M2BV47_9GAMM|nr:chemotaxis protein CheB [Solimonas terrae]NGY06115.1 chemotaxis protein CheB [Solimonas terrae]
MSTRRPSERIVVVAASAGGVAALRRLFAGLAADFDWPLVVVLHIAGDNIDSLLEVLGVDSALPVIEARHGARPLPGTIHVAPSGYHLLIEDEHSFALSVDPRVRFARPSADVLFSSAADACGERVIGIVLTGTNDDGARGLADIRRHGGLGFVQDPREAEEAAMPRAAIERAGADAVLTIDELARRLLMEFRQ